MGDEALGNSHRCGIILIGIMAHFPTDKSEQERFEPVLWPANASAVAVKEPEHARFITRRCLTGAGTTPNTLVFARE